MIDALARIESVVILLLNAYWLLMIISILLTWVRPDPRYALVRFIRGSTEPVFNLARRLFPFLQAGAIDFSPIVPLLLLELLVQLVPKLFQQLAILVG
ncbi:MAG TPA: YggT family protein [bacterium]|nr:YggT family protein [bacterium]